MDVSTSFVVPLDVLFHIAISVNFATVGDVSHHGALCAVHAVNVGLTANIAKEAVVVMFAKSVSIPARTAMQMAVTTVLKCLNVQMMIAIKSSVWIVSMVKKNLI
mmetsp:Transcript_6120/g.13866  ORF Transcript_6120/g.13866 Transcript_6120/m.13866 type:complete len:105 (+) Transcript_6120:793-1107(+)